jgi:hypothetical protein
MKDFHTVVSISKKAWNQTDAIVFARLVRKECEDAAEDLVKIILREKEEYPIMKTEDEEPKAQRAIKDPTDPRDGT